MSQPIHFAKHTVKLVKVGSWYACFNEQAHLIVNSADRSNRLSIRPSTYNFEACDGVWIPYWQPYLLQDELIKRGIRLIVP